MKIRVLYFASFRELLGRTSDDFDVPSTVTTLGELQKWMRLQGEPYETAFLSMPRLRGSVNQEMAKVDTLITEGAEIAFFPPVTGG